MGLSTFLIAWILAVFAMTGVSAIFARLCRCELREHILLTQLLSTFSSNSSKKKSSILKGWIVHFAMGLFFMAVYELAWYLTDFNRSIFWGITFGMVMGIIGIIGWWAMFSLHPRPPELRFKLFYSQLFIVHVIFSLTALLIYYALQ